MTRIDKPLPQKPIQDAAISVDFLITEKDKKAGKPGSACYCQAAIALRRKTGCPVWVLSKVIYIDRGDYLERFYPEGKLKRVQDAVDWGATRTPTGSYRALNPLPRPPRRQRVIKSVNVKVKSTQGDKIVKVKAGKKTKITRRPASRPPGLRPTALMLAGKVSIG